MINLIEGKINLHSKYISIASDYKYLNGLAEQGLIEKRKDPDNEGNYFYLEAVGDSMRFSVIISFLNKRVEWFLLRWLDGPCTSKGWDEVNEKSLKDEYHVLSNFVENMFGGPPDNKKNRKRTWRANWGQVEVSYEPRDFVVSIFMKPRLG